MGDPRLLAAVTERDFQGFVVSLATLHGWRTYHTYDSRRSNAGFPDLILARPGELFAAELKTERGKATAAQQEWLDLFASAGIEAPLWRPSDQDAVMERLQRRPQ